MQLHTNGPAQTQALTLPEIVTSILHAMDMRTLIAAQRVCRMWAHLIHESRSLQQALFLLPAHNADHSRPRVYNPLMAEVFPSFFPQPGNIFNEPSDDSIEKANLTSVAFVKDPTKREMYLRPEASWRRMLTTQPPIHTIGEFSYSTSPFGMDWKGKRASRQEDGLRMTTLFEMMVDFGHLWNGSGISIGFGGESPMNARSKFLRSSEYVDSDRINADWAKLLAETDLVFTVAWHVTCTSPDPDDSDWEKSDDEIAWEGITEWYEQSKMTLSDLPMECWYDGGEGWN